MDNFCTTHWKAVVGSPHEPENQFRQTENPCCWRPVQSTVPTNTLLLGQSLQEGFAIHCSRRSCFTDLPNPLPLSISRRGLSLHEKPRPHAADPQRTPRSQLTSVCYEVTKQVGEISRGATKSGNCLGYWADIAFVPVKPKLSLSEPRTPPQKKKHLRRPQVAKSRRRNAHQHL